jgi:hypothetical protein
MHCKSMPVSGGDRSCINEVSMEKERIWVEIGFEDILEVGIQIFLSDPIDILQEL